MTANGDSAPETPRDAGSLASAATQRSPWSAYVLGGLVVLAAVLLGEGLANPRPAAAQFVDSAAQRNELIAEQQQTNQKLTQIIALLREIRDVQVKPGAAKPGAGASAAPATPATPRKP